MTQKPEWRGWPGFLGRAIGAYLNADEDRPEKCQRMSDAYDQWVEAGRPDHDPAGPVGDDPEAAAGAALRAALDRLDGERKPRGDLSSLSAYVVRLCDVAIAARAALAATGSGPAPENPYRATAISTAADTTRDGVGAIHARRRADAWDEGYAAGRAAGSGTPDRPPVCPTCLGNGQVSATPGRPEDGPEPCPDCTATCPHCNGTFVRVPSEGGADPGRTEGQQ